jgi:hypothetical protein
MPKPPQGRYFDTSMLVYALPIIAVLLVASTGCGSSPGEPSGHPAQGTWSGSAVDKGAGTGTMRLVLQYSAAQQTIAGTFLFTPAGGSAVSGTVGGSASATPLDEVMSCEDHPNVGLMSLTVDGSRMQGTYFFTGPCPPLTGGTVDLSKQ